MGPWRVRIGGAATSGAPAQVWARPLAGGDALLAKAEEAKRKAKKLEEESKSVTYKVRCPRATWGACGGGESIAPHSAEHVL